MQIPSVLFLLYATQKPSRPRSKGAKALASVPKARASASRVHPQGCARGRGGQTNTRSRPSFALHPEDRGAPEAVKAATACAKRKAQRADVRKDEARGRAPRRGASCVFAKNANFTCAKGASFTKAYKYPLSHLLLYPTQKPTRALAPKERKRLQQCASTRASASRVHPQGCARGRGENRQIRDPALVLHSTPRTEARPRR